MEPIIILVILFTVKLALVYSKNKTLINKRNNKLLNIIIDLLISLI